MKRDDGMTRREFNAKFGKSNLSPECYIPDAGRHIWDWFWTLSNRRRSGPEPLSYQEIGEWQRLCSIIARPEEIDAIMKMDDAYLVVTRQEQDEAMAAKQEAKK